jgi:uncharacterized protein YecE (DUF72 family)
VSPPRIGISGWRYVPWRGTFYPKDLKQKDELHYASRKLNSIEINGTFYSLQRPSSFRAWYEQTPGDFVFSIKGPNFITHMRRLREPAGALANFFASGLLLLKEKLGPILWQFPPNFSYDRDRFEAFFKLLPRNTNEAAKLARRGDGKLSRDRMWTKTDKNRPLRYAVEIRHQSFVDPSFIALLRRHKIALVIADTAGKWPLLEDMTSDFVYLRLHGDEELYASGYSDAALVEWAKRLRAWQGGKEPKNARRCAAPLKRHPAHRDLFIYFDNDVKVRAPYDAMKLAGILGRSE